VENPAFTLSRTPHKDPEPDPLLDEHTEIVLTRLLGLTPEQVGQLAAEGAVELLNPAAGK